MNREERMAQNIEHRSVFIIYPNTEWCEVRLQEKQQQPKLHDFSFQICVINSVV